MNFIIFAVMMLSLSRSSLQEFQHEGQTETKEETRGAENIPFALAAPLIPPHSAPCFVDDILVTLRESLEEDGRITPESLAQFAVCANNSLMLRQLATHASNSDFSALYPTKVLLNKEEDNTVLTLVFDSPTPLQTVLNTVLLLSFKNMSRTVGMNFASPHLNPCIQAPCVSDETQHVLLKVKDGLLPQTWKILLSQTVLPDSQKDAVDGGDTGSAVIIMALLLFSPQRRTDTSPNSIHLSHNSFLCELRHFLTQSLPQDLHTPVVNLESLRSLPSQPIGLSSSETLLAGLINSSALTILSFTHGSLLQAHREELALSPALLEELRRRLEQTLADVLETMGEDSRARGRLERLKQLSGCPFTHQVEGKLQYRAFLLFKALQTATQVFNQPRGQRSARDHSGQPSRSVCGLVSLTVSLGPYLIAPSLAIINNCQGSCSYPMIRGTNHAVALNSHIDSGHTDTRAPCCVPVAYQQLEVVKVIEEETFVESEPDMVATECACR